MENSEYNLLLEDVTPLSKLEREDEFIMFYPSEFEIGDILNFYGKKFKVIELLENNKIKLKRVY